MEHSKKEIVLETKDGKLFLKPYKKGLEIESYSGEDIHLEIPAAVEDDGKKLQIISVGKKAFLSCKNLRIVKFSDAIEEIGDWAFAYCDQLRELYLPKKQITFGRGIFRECVKLRRILVEGAHQDVGGLLASTVTILDAEFLFTPLLAGSDEWISQWDNRMLLILHTDDQEGYSKLLLCGEEDYGSKENNLDYFLNQKRKAKVRIAYMRLLNPYGISKETKAELEEYLKMHTKNADSDETWQVLFEEHGDDAEYYKLFVEMDCLNADNFDKILEDIGTSYPEMKAYFMKYKEEKIGYSNFFEDILNLF